MSHLLPKQKEQIDVSHSKWEKKNTFYDHENGSRYPKLVSIHVKPVLNIQQSLGKVASMTPGSLVFPLKYLASHVK